MDMSAPPSQAWVVRYGVTRLLGEFVIRGPHIPVSRGTQVIVRSDRGTEWGEVLCAASESTREWLGIDKETGRILRLPTLDDERHKDRVAQLEVEEFNSCKQLIGEMSLQMQLVDTEHVFGGERIVFYYVSEQRIDFRELVKVLAKRHQSRIEMRQIGIRDEARLLADYGDCGKPVCCNTHLKEMPPVSMKMAKLQKATLDPSKISGRCGRLKCCLRYEYDTYEEHRKELPPIGATVVTKLGQGRVVAQELLAKKLMVAYEGQRTVLTDQKEIITVVGKKGLPAAVEREIEEEEAEEFMQSESSRPPRPQRPPRNPSENRNQPDR
ncbi:PSP1 domain protein [Planctopirus limnophila DSM 3776]|uniref:PSP1 domain protein n=2 Tax=Planctopirus limnophila TaxID=120 RepID=D5SML3_PLAL2|nr:PSP1 domain protein [Planctopirus limnophila DSM 3776]